MRYRKLKQAPSQIIWKLATWSPLTKIPGCQFCGISIFQCRSSSMPLDSAPARFGGKAPRLNTEYTGGHYRTLYTCPYNPSNPLESQTPPLLALSIDRSVLFNVNCIFRIFISRRTYRFIVIRSYGGLFCILFTDEYLYRDAPFFYRRYKWYTTKWAFLKVIYSKSVVYATINNYYPVDNFKNIKWMYFLIRLITIYNGLRCLWCIRKNTTETGKAHRAVSQCYQPTYSSLTSTCTPLYWCSRVIR